MKAVGTTLCDHSDLGPGGAPLANAIVGCCHTELVHRKGGSRQHAVKRIPGEFVVVAEAIKQNIILIAALAIDHTGARVVIILKLVLAVECYTRLQAEQQHVVFCGERQVLNGEIVHRLADAGIRGVEQRCFAGDSDHLSDCADIHLDIERSRKVHPKSHPRLLVLLEALSLDSYSVRARKYFQERIQAVCAGGRRTTNIRLNIGEAYLGSDKRGAGRVCYCTSERSSRLSPCA